MSKLKKVRLGLVGCGKRGRSVSRLFKIQRDCEITTLMDLYEGPARFTAKELDLPDAKIFTDFKKMLREAPVDALFFAGDPTTQADEACEAMRTGRHVCTEVPAAFSIDQCWNLVKTVEKTGCKYQLMEQARYWGFIETWKQMHDRGELGHVALAQGEYVHYLPNYTNWTDVKTGEIFGDLTKPKGRKVEAHWRYSTAVAEPLYYLPHTLSPLLRILDDRVMRVSCMGTRKQSYTFVDPKLKVPWRDIEYALMHTEKDTVLLVGAGFSLPHVPRGPTGCHWYELRGTKGSVTSPRHKSDGFRVWKDGSSIYQEMDLSLTPPDADEMQARTGHGGADFKPVNTFIRSIIENKTPPMNVYRSVETAAPAILGVESAKRGGVLLEVPDFRRYAKKKKD